MGVALAIAVTAVAIYLGVLVAGRLRQLALGARARERLARALADREGATPERAIDVASPAQIEPRVARLPCPGCGGTLAIDTHEVDPQPHALLRRVDARCVHCDGRFSTWFRVRAALPD